MAVKFASIGTPNPAEQRRIASEAEIERQREIAQSFASQAANTQKIANPLQGINYAAQSMLGAAFAKRADKQEGVRRDAMAQAITGALGDTSAYGIPEDQMRQILAIDPSFGSQLLSAKIEKQMNPPEMWEPAEINGIKGQRSTATGKFDPFPAGADATKVVPKGAAVYENGQWITPPAGVVPQADFNDVSSLRKEIQDIPSYKSYKQAEPIFSTMVDAAARDSKAADLNLVYGLGKIFDPNSVVREGEMVLVKDSASLPDWVIGEINSLNGGARLLPETRMAILREAQSRMSAYKTAFENDLAQFEGVAERYNIPRADAIPQLGEMPALPNLGAPVAPPVGAGVEPPPPGVDPADWAVMTPEEKSLWKR